MRGMFLAWSPWVGDSLPWVMVPLTMVGRTILHIHRVHVNHRAVMKGEDSDGK